MNGFTFLESVKRMPLMPLPVRSVYVPLSDGRILLSPGSALTVKHLETAKDVTDIVAPNLFHCAGVPQASSVFPKAKLWGAKGVTQLKKNISWSQELSIETWPYQNELPLIEIAGIPKINECVFIHKHSKSLIVTDMCFNILDAKGIGPWIILNLFGTYRKLGVSKFYLKFIEDKKAFLNSLEQLFSFDFENIILSHGHNVIGNGKDQLKKAFEEKGITLN